MAASAVLCAGNVAVITGGASGIGKATAKACVTRGMHVFIADLDQAELDATCEELRGTLPPGSNAAGSIIGVQTNVRDPAKLERLCNMVVEAHGNCHFLMNNAGTGDGGGALAPLDKWQKVIEVNTWGPIHGCMAFLPLMKASGERCLIVNTGSKQGITMPPGNLAYNTSKAAVKAFTEGLQHELREEGGNVSSALLVPGWVNTSIFLKSKRDEALAKGEEFNPESVFFHEGKPARGAWMPAQVVDFMISEIDSGKFYVICPDNDVDRETDNLRMTWTMQDITEDRPPLSRWHPDYKDAFTAFLDVNRSLGK